MPKRITPRDRLLTFAVKATADELQDAIDTLKAVQAGRFPKKPRKVKETAVRALPTERRDSNVA